MGFFFGAGASSSFGIPTMGKMTDQFTEEVSSHPESRVYNNIKRKLDEELAKDKVDVESIFSVIEGLKNYNDEELGHLAIFAARSFLNQSLLDLKIGFEMKQIKALEQRFQAFIRRNCRINVAHRGDLRNVYRHFFDILASKGGHEISESGARFSSEWIFFTTNYDRCLEAYWREDALVDINTGTKDHHGKRVLDSELFFGTPNTGLLIKLHGSTTWLHHKDFGFIEEKEVDIDLAKDSSDAYDEELVIYPLSQKALYVEPYIKMLLRLGTEVKKRKVWIIIGYSFRDPIIQNIFVNYLTYKQRIVLVHPHAKEIFKRRLKACRAFKVPIERKFGEQNFKAVNNRIFKEFMK